MREFHLLLSLSQEISNQSLNYSRFFVFVLDFSHNWRQPEFSLEGKCIKISNSFKKHLEIFMLYYKSIWVFVTFYKFIISIRATMKFKRSYQQLSCFFFYLVLCRPGLDIPRYGIPYGKGQSCGKYFTISVPMFATQQVKKLCPPKENKSIFPKQVQGKREGK